MSDVVIFRKGIRVLLRPLERADVPTLRRWMNDPEVTQYLMRRLPLMEKEEEVWIDRVAESKTDIVLGIVLVEDCRLIGVTGLHEINGPNRTAITDTVIGEANCWGKGYGTEAKMLLLDLAFNALDLHSILSKVLSCNERSIAYARKCGYRETGRLPQWVRHPDGERYDEVHFVVTQEAWRPLWKAYDAERKRHAEAKNA